MNRREFLWQSGGGLGGVALAALLGADGLLAADRVAERHRPPAAARRRPASSRRRPERVVQLFMAGAASHIDLFDFKPELIKRHGQPSDFGEHVETFQDGLGPWLKPVFEFRPHGIVRQDAQRGRRAAGGRGRRHRLHPQLRRQDRRAQPGDAAPDNRASTVPASRRWARGSATGWAA